MKGKHRAGNKCRRSLRRTLLKTLRSAERSATILLFLYDPHNRFSQHFRQTRCVAYERATLQRSIQILTPTLLILWIIPPRVVRLTSLALLFAAIPQHRLTGGFGVEDILPGIDLDMFAGGMFAAPQRFGVTTASLDGYWVGFGMAWRLGAS